MISFQANQTGPVFDDWFTEQLETTTIEVNPRFGRFDRETGEVLLIRSTAKEPAGGWAHRIVGRPDLRA